jgi:uncharacterized protein YaaQ
VTSSDKMKLALAIVPNPDAEAIIETLTSSKFGVTRISSSGGFLRRGQAVLLIGVETEKVRECIRLIREHSAPAIDSGLKRVVVFILKVDQFEQI